MTDFLKIAAWFLICLCIVILSGRFYRLQKRVEQLEKVVKIEEQAERDNDKELEEKQNDDTVRYW